MTAAVANAAIGKHYVVMASMGRTEDIVIDATRQTDAIRAMRDAMHTVVLNSKMYGSPPMMRMVMTEHDRGTRKKHVVVSARFYDMEWHIDRSHTPGEARERKPIEPMSRRRVGRRRH